MPCSFFNSGYETRFLNFVKSIRELQDAFPKEKTDLKNRVTTAASVLRKHPPMLNRPRDLYPPQKAIVDLTNQLRTHSDCLSGMKAQQAWKDVLTKANGRKIQRGDIPPVHLDLRPALRLLDKGRTQKISVITLKELLPTKIHKLLPSLTSLMDEALGERRKASTFKAFFAIPGYHGTVAVNESQEVVAAALGFILSIDGSKYCYLEALARRANLPGLNLGRVCLARWVEQALNKQGIDGLLLNVGTQNKPAVKLYQDFGFEVIDGDDYCYDDEPGLLMLKKIGLDCPAPSDVQVQKACDELLDKWAVPYNA